MTSHARWLLVLGLSIAVPPSYPIAQEAGQTATTVTAKTWLGRQKEIEDFIRTAEIVRLEDVSIGVTKPQRAYFAPGGPAESVLWRRLPPGIHGGFWDSYKGDIVAYELDKLLGLEMVPPAVERRYKGDLGGATYWVKPARMYKELMNTPNAPRGPTWDRDARRMKMFDNLVMNPDRNAGNLLLDPGGNLILIDHSRAFTSSTRLVNKLERVDVDLWEKMRALTAESVTAALGAWLGSKEIRALLERRDRMAVEIDKLVHTKGEAAVLVR